MAGILTTDWDDMVDTTYKIGEDQFGRGIQFDRILAKTLGIQAKYQVVYIFSSTW